MKQISVTAEIEIPDPPIFFKTTGGMKLPVEAIPEANLEQIGAEWTASLVNKAKERASIRRATGRAAHA